MNTRGMTLGYLTKRIAENLDPSTVCRTVKLFKEPRKLVWLKTLKGTTKTTKRL